MSDWTHEITLLRGAGILLERGLTERELAAAERTCEAAFPPDIRAFLATVLPLGNGFPDWRDPSSDMIRQTVAWPFEGVAFDIEHNDFWWRDWGARPAALTDAIEVARQRVAAAPRLIPVYSHRYMPAVPLAAGNPVFSVYQTDVIYYGSDLSDYIAAEFGRQRHGRGGTDKRRSIPFWSDLAEAD
jgi:hypothetical protein